VWSSVVSHFFYKASLPESIANPKIVEYQYWLDTNFASAVTVSTTAQQQVNVSSLVPMSSLADGVHSFNIRFADSVGVWSSVVSSFFYKIPQQTIVQNDIIEYRYWVDTSFSNAVTLPVSPNQQVNVMDDLDLTQIPKGEHLIHFQFRDTLDLWSVVITDTVQKISLPVANFDYVVMPDCDSTVVQFTDSSIDGDIYLWDFGDGSSDTVANPSHTFYAPGNYVITQTITDTLTLADSTYQISLNVTGNTFGSVSETVCDSYTSPSGNYSFTQSGTFADTILNSMGCDSILTIQLTILNSTTYTDMISSCESYTWIDGNTYTASTNAPTVTLVNAAGCDSVVTLDLTILQPTAYTDVISSCASYTWIDGNTYTTSTNAPTFTLVNAAGCDSVVTLDLTILTVDTSVIQSGNTLEAIATNASFQWLDCGDNYALIAGANSSVFIPEKSGNYAVEVSQNTCVDTSSCFTVSNVSIVEQTFSTEISAFPNPTDGHFTIDLGNMYSKVEITIYDINSRIVYRNIYAQADIIQLQLTEPAGLYMVAIRSENQSAIIRLVKR
jgi:hypothetical protein